MAAEAVGSGTFLHTKCDVVRQLQDARIDSAIP